METVTQQYKWYQRTAMLKCKSSVKAIENCNEMSYLKATTFANTVTVAYNRTREGLPDSILKWHIKNMTPFCELTASNVSRQTKFSTQCRSSSKFWETCKPSLAMFDTIQLLSAESKCVSSKCTTAGHVTLQSPLRTRFLPDMCCCWHLEVASSAFNSRQKTMICFIRRNRTQAPLDVATHAVRWQIPP